MTKATTQNQFTVACDINDVTFDIFNKDNSETLHLTTTEVLDSEISFNRFAIYSYLNINDQIDIQYQLKGSQNLGYIVFILDRAKNYYRREFQIISADKTRSVKNKTISFMAQDIVSYILDKLYISKTYKNKKLSDIFQDIFDTYVKPNLKLDNIELSLDSNIILESFVLTAQDSVLNLIVNECERQGLAFYQDKKSIVMIPYKKLKPQDLPLSNIRYTDFSNNPNSPFDILSCNLIRPDKATKIPKSLVFAYDKSNKTMKIMDQNIENIGIPHPENIQNNEGYEYVCQEYLYDDNLFAETYKSFMNDSQLEIVVAGDVGNIKIFQQYDILLRSGEVKDEEHTGNIIDSGKYFLINYVDKLMASRYYITKMTLVRFKDIDA